jgi:hypothetical protein
MVLGIPVSIKIGMSDHLIDSVTWGTLLFLVDVIVQEWKVAFFFFHCELNICVESIDVVQKFCQFFSGMGPNDKSVIYIS